MAKITDNSNELSFHQLTSTSTVLHIPLFQRPYVWTQRQLDRMISEIEAITEEQDNSRFLGAVIAVQRPTNPSQPTPHEIVDGQQRLTTLYLFLLAAAQVAARQGKSDYARGLVSTNLIVDWAQELASNTKLQPSISDRGQFRTIFERVGRTGDFNDWLPLKARLPESSGPDSGPLSRQYGRIHSYLKKRLEDHGFDALESSVEAIRNSMTFVFILLKDPGSATTVFEGLNDPGVPISVGDLVKNEIFARVGYDEPRAQLLHDGKWIPFRQQFAESFDDYFFPFAVVHKPNVSRTEMFGELRKLWDGLSADQILHELDQFSDAFLAIHGVCDPMDTYGNEVGACVHRLVRLRRPSSVYPFVLKLLREFLDGKVAKNDVIGCLDTIESFLVRRALCGIEPTGLLALFRTMWSNTESHPTSAKVASAILKRLTVEWPTDERLTRSIASRPLYGSNVAQFVVAEYDRTLGIEQPDISEMTLEHVMPRTYCDEWSDVVSKAQHSKLKDLWANLVPLSMPVNNLVDQSTFEHKKKVFAHESMYKSTRQLGATHDNWGEEEILARSQGLAEWAISRWKKPSNSD